MQEISSATKKHKFFGWHRGIYENVTTFVNLSYLVVVKMNKYQKLMNLNYEFAASPLALHPLIILMYRDLF